MGMLTLEYEPWSNDMVTFRVVDQTERLMDEDGEEIIITVHSDSGVLIRSHADQKLLIRKDLDYFQTSYPEKIDLYVRGYVEDEDYWHTTNMGYWTRIIKAVFRYNTIHSNNTLKEEDVVWMRHR